MPIHLELAHGVALQANAAYDVLHEQDPEGREAETLESSYAHLCSVTGKLLELSQGQNGQQPHAGIGEAIGAQDSEEKSPRRGIRRETKKRVAHAVGVIIEAGGVIETSEEGKTPGPILADRLGMNPGQWRSFHQTVRKLGVLVFEKPPGNEKAKVFHRIRVDREVLREMVESGELPEFPPESEVSVATNGSKAPDNIRNTAKDGDTSEPSNGVGTQEASKKVVEGLEGIRAIHKPNFSRSNEERYGNKRSIHFCFRVEREIFDKRIGVPVYIKKPDEIRLMLAIGLVMNEETFHDFSKTPEERLDRVVNNWVNKGREEAGNGKKPLTKGEVMELLGQAEEKGFIVYKQEDPLLTSKGIAYLKEKLKRTGSTTK